VLSPTERFLYAIAKTALLVWAKLMFRLSFQGREHVPPAGPVLIASNHVSHLDPPLVGLGVPRHIFHIAKKELARVPVVGLTMRTFRTILIDRSRGQSALGETVKYLDKGAAVIIFPEGTRSLSGRLQRGRSGASVLALKTGVPVVPAAIIGSEKCFPKHSRWIRPGKITVRFGPPLHFQRYRGEVIPRDLLNDATERIMAAIAALLPPEMQPIPEAQEGEHAESTGSEMTMEKQHG